jgi:hypothetical protein
MSTHTPGPWEIPDQNAISGISVKTARRISGRSGKPVCRVPLGPTDNDTARLIAAAPDLLAALQEIKKQTDESRDFRSAAMCAAIAHAALAKAEGVHE